MQDTTIALVKEYNTSTKTFSRHCYNIKHQTDVCRMKRINLSENEVWLHIDFAENWYSKSQVGSGQHVLTNAGIPTFVS